MKYPVHVLCVMSTLDRGGAESMVMTLFRHMDHDKVTFDFVKHTNQVGDFEDEIKELGGSIYTAPRYRINNHFSYIKWWKNFLNIHPEYVLIHGHFFSISAVYFMVAQSKDRITIAHSHSTETINNRKEKPLLHWVVNQYIKRIEKYTDYALACSYEAGNWLFKNKPFQVLNNAIDVEKFRFNEDIRNIVRNDLGFTNELVLGTVANLSDVKNPMGLIDIFVAVKKKNLNAKLLWIGEGNERGSIEKRIHQDGLEKDVILLGRREDVPSLLQGFDAFLLPSFSEGLPVSLIEAQGAGLQCFISDRVTKEVDITGLCTFLPINKPDNWAEQWADAIVGNLTQRIDMSAQIAEKGYDIHFTAEWLEDFYLDIYKQLC